MGVHGSASLFELMLAQLSLLRARLLLPPVGVSAPARVRTLVPITVAAATKSATSVGVSVTTSVGASTAAGTATAPETGAVVRVDMSGAYNDGVSGGSNACGNDGCDDCSC